MPTTPDQPQSAEPNLPGSEGTQSNNTTANRRDTLAELQTALYEPRTSKQPEQRSEVPSTPDASTPEQERKDNPTEPQQEADKDASQTPPTQQNLSPEEAQRREEQSFKDRYYALERERDRERIERESQLERQRIDQMSQNERVALSRFESQVKPLTDQVWQLHNSANDLDQKGQDALAEGDRELASYFFQQRDVMRQSEQALSNNVRWQYDSFNQTVQQYRQSVHVEKLNAQEKQLSRSLGKQGLTLDDLKAVNPKLDLTDNFAVIEAVADAKEAKLKAEVKATREEADRVVKEERAKWRTDSPAARPDRPVTGGSRGASANRGGPGSGTSDIAAGLGFGKR